MKAVVEYLSSLKEHPGFDVYDNVVHGRYEFIKKNLSTITDIHLIVKDKSSKPTNPTIAERSKQIVSCEVYNSPTGKQIDAERSETESDITIDSDSDSTTGSDNSDSSDTSSSSSEEADDEVESESDSEDSFIKLSETISENTGINENTQTGEHVNTNPKSIAEWILNDVLISVVPQEGFDSQLDAFRHDLSSSESECEDDEPRKNNIADKFGEQFDNLKLDLSFINSSSDITSDEEVIYSDNDEESGSYEKPHVQTRRYYTKMLDTAVRRGHENIALLLLEKRALPTDQTLWDAIGEGMCEAVRKCTVLEYKVDFSKWTLKAPNLKTIHLHETTYALCKAVYSGHLEMVKLVFAACGELNLVLNDAKLHSHTVACGMDFSTPLITACICGHIEIMEWLIYMGANVNLSNTTGYTPLMGAVFESPKHKTTQAVQLLLTKGASVSTKDKFHHTALLYCVQRNDDISTESISEILSLLLKHGADVNDETLWSITSRSAMSGCAMKTYGLCSYSFNAIHKTVQQTNESTAYALTEMLLKHNIKYDNVTRYTQHASVAKLLVEQGLVTDLTDFFEVVCRRVCCKELISYYIESGYCETQSDRKGRNALHHAARSGCSETINHLLSSGYSVDAEDNSGWTPLMHACYNYESTHFHDLCHSREYVTRVQVLLMNGSDPNHSSRSGHTPLRCSQSKKQIEEEHQTHARKCSCSYIVILMLLYNNCNPNSLTLCLSVMLPRGYILSTRKHEIPTDMQEGIKPATPAMISYSLYQSAILDLLYMVGANLWKITNNVFIDGRINTCSDGMLDLLMKVYRQLRFSKHHKLQRLVNRLRSSPRKLCDICRITIRGSIHRPIHQSLQKLPLSQNILDYIRIPEIHEFLESCQRLPIAQV